MKLGRIFGRRNVRSGENPVTPVAQLDDGADPLQFGQHFFGRNIRRISPH
jgi:hypothetical protein